MPPSLVFFQLSVVVLILVTHTTTSNVLQPTQTHLDEERSNQLLTKHPQNVEDTKHAVLNNDENSGTSDEEHNDDDGQHHHNPSIWSHVMSKRYPKIMVARAGNIGDSRLWAIPYRFGKRATAMHFRLGKKNASL